jgi:hypothetical protein
MILHGPYSKGLWVDRQLNGKASLSLLAVKWGLGYLKMNLLRNIEYGSRRVD